MKLRYLLDTGVVSSPAAKVPSAAIVAKLARQGSSCAIGAPALHELTYGVARLPEGKKRERLKGYIEEVVMNTFPVLPYDLAAARWHGKERARLEALGKAAPFVDGQIAAIARTNDLILVTTNSADFDAFDGLQVEDWSN